MNHPQWLLVFIICLSFVPRSCQQSISSPDEQWLTVKFQYGFGNELNTAEQTFTKDMVTGPDRTVRMWLTEAEQSALFDTLQAVGFLGLPDTLTARAPDSITVDISPNPGWQILHIHSSTFDKSIVWHLPLDATEEAQAVHRIQRTLLDIIHSKPAYQRLPEPESGYCGVYVPSSKQAA